jgi:putative acetyltransferase
MNLALERPDQPEVVRLIDALDAYQKPLYPAESHHGIDIAALLQPEVVFAVARDDCRAAIGCGAIVLTPEYGEVKRMYVPPAQRGRGIARALLQFLEAQASESGCRRFALETGIHQPEALALYARMGYQRCEAFGAYRPDPLSVFMQKTTVV